MNSQYEKKVLPCDRSQTVVADDCSSALGVSTPEILIARFYGQNNNLKIVVPNGLITSQDLMSLQK